MLMLDVVVIVVDGVAIVGKKVRPPPGRSGGATSSTLATF